MESWLLVLLGAVAGATAVAVTMGRARAETSPEAPPAPTDSPAVPQGVADVLAVLRESVVLVTPGDVVVHACDDARRLGLVRGDRLVEARLSELVAQVRGDGVIREEELVLRRSRRAAPQQLEARVAPLDGRLVLVLVEDRTRERRVDDVRRDFVANVSHELKTPVGALSLLAEAVAQAADDPAAVRRFADRMQIESHRLGRLVQQVIELSRLQDDQLVEEPVYVDVDALVAYALDRSRTDADARDIRLVRGGTEGLAVRGSLGQLQVALGNLVENAVTYSEAGSRVAVVTRPVDDTVAISVSDQGIGIPAAELDRIFERFYRVDPARATTTGGTGLGLSIVKHVAASHGGEVRVWSVERTGSSFTLVLPGWTEVDAPAVPPGDPGTVVVAEQAVP